MLNQFSRTELLIGKEGMEKLENSRVVVFKLAVVLADIRSTGQKWRRYPDLIDDDKVCLTNINARFTQQERP